MSLIGFLQRLFSKSSPVQDKHAKLYKSLVGKPPRDIQILKTAFTHRSKGYTTAEGQPINYERLEFLGDAVLGTIISEYLYKEVPGGDEGYLTKMRSKIVSRRHLNELGEDFKLLDHLDTEVPLEHYGRNVHGNLFEAFVGAVYCDIGYDGCKDFIYRQIIDEYVDLDRLEKRVISYKSLVIEWCQQQKLSFEFRHNIDDGQEPEPYFSVAFLIDGKLKGRGRARSKKKAEEKAAQRAYYSIQGKESGQ